MIHEKMVNFVKRWEGTFTILMTAFTKDGGLDENAMRSSVDFVIGGGVHGVVPLGSFGENPYLTQDEKKRVIDIVVDQVNGRVPVVAGTGEVSTDKTIALSNYALNAGADAAMICLPLYWRLREEDILSHYTSVSSAVDLPIFLYNIPSTTHLELTSEIVVNLSEFDNIVGIKESINDLEQIGTVIETAKKPFSVFVGMSRLLLDVLKLGGAGCFDPVSNTFPEVIAGIYSAFKAGDLKKAEKLQKSLSEYSSITRPGGDAFIASRKEVMKLMGMPIESIVKSPIPKLNAEQRKKIRENVEKAGLLNATLDR